MSVKDYFNLRQTGQPLSGGCKRFTESRRRLVKRRHGRRGFAGRKTALPYQVGTAQEDHQSDSRALASLETHGGPDGSRRHLCKLRTLDRGWHSRQPGAAISSASNAKRNEDFNEKIPPIRTLHFALCSLNHYLLCAVRFVTTVYGRVFKVSEYAASLKNSLQGICGVLSICCVRFSDSYTTSCVLNPLKSRCFDLR